MGAAVWADLVAGAGAADPWRRCPTGRVVAPLVATGTASAPVMARRVSMVVVRIRRITGW